MEKRQCQQNKPPNGIASKLLSFGGKLVEIFRANLGIAFAFLSAVALTVEDMLLSIAGNILHPSAVLLWNAVCVTIFTSVAILVVQPPFSIGLDFRTVIWLLVGGLLCGTGGMLCTLGIILSSPADAVALFFTLPVVTMMFQIILREEQVTLQKCFLALCSAAGAILVAQPRILFSGSSIRDTDNIVGIYLSAMSPFVFSIGMIITAKQQVHSLYTMFIFTLSEIPLLCIIFQASIFPPKLLNAGFLVLVAFEYFFGYMLLFTALAIQKTSTVSIILSSEVVLTSLAQCIFLAIPLDWKSVLGSCLITATCVGTSLSRDTTERSIENPEDEPEREKLVTGRTLHQ